MAPHHRPDIEAWRLRAKTREAYLWPYINLEDLVKPKIMLLLLHFRGRHHPKEVVHSDLDQANLGKAIGMTMPAFLNEVASPLESDIMPNPGLPPALTDVTSLQIVALEAPYRIPAHLDLARLRALTSAERNSQEDHLWALREDPGYFADAMRDRSVHRQEMVLDTNGHEHPKLKEPNRLLFWNRVLVAVVVESHFGFATFDEVVRQIDKLAILHARYRDQITPEASLPADLTLAMQKLHFLLDAAKVDLIQNLRAGLFASPEFRRFCFREPQQAGTSMMRTAYRPPRQDHAVKRIMPLFKILFDKEQLRLFGLHAVTDEIRRLMQSDKDVEALISPWTASRRSSLSVVSECLHQLHLFKPSSRKLEDDMESTTVSNEATTAETFNPGSPSCTSSLRDLRYTNLRIQATGSSIIQFTGDAISKTQRSFARLKLTLMFSGKQSTSVAARTGSESRSRIL